MANARIDDAYAALGHIMDRASIAERRHAELAALVKDLTVAVEALENRVTVLAALELDRRNILGIDPPDIGNLPDTGNTWNATADKGKG